MSKRSQRNALFSVLLVSMLSVPAASAQVAVSSLPEVTVDRDADEFTVDTRPRPDIDSANTALVFTNPTKWVASRVRCVAYSKNGTPIGRTFTEVPPKGLRYIRASDFRNGGDFVGQVECYSPTLVIGSAFFFGPGLTELPVRQRRSDDLVRIRFPVVAHY